MIERNRIPLVGVAVVLLGSLVLCSCSDDPTTLDERARTWRLNRMDPETLQRFKRQSTLLNLGTWFYLRAGRTHGVLRRQVESP